MPKGTALGYAHHHITTHSLRKTILFSIPYVHQIDQHPVARVPFYVSEVLVVPQAIGVRVLTS